MSLPFFPTQNQMKPVYLFASLGLSQSTYIYLRFVLLLFPLLRLVLPRGSFPSSYPDKFCRHFWFLPSLAHSSPIFVIKAFRLEVNTIRCSSNALISIGYLYLVLAFLLCNTQNQNWLPGVPSRLFCHIYNIFGYQLHCCLEGIKMCVWTVLKTMCRFIKCSAANAEDKSV